MKEAEIREEQEKLADEAARLKTASQQQDADNAAIAAKMDEIRKREKELAEQERTFKQRVDDAVKRREKAKEKRSRLWSKAYGEDAYNPYDQ